MRLSFKPFVSIGVLFTVTINCLFGQQNMEVNKVGVTGLASKDYYPLSPTASSLGTFGQTAVTYYTGSPVIGIPLSNLKYKELEVNLSLSYQNTGGNKPDVIPGFTGNGWLFSCGGAITMISKGISVADIGNSQNMLALPYATNDPAWKDSTTLANNMLLKKFPYDYNSKRYDEFSYNFDGASGRFYSDYPDTVLYPYGITQHIKTIQGEDLTIQKIITGNKVISLPSEPQDGTNHFAAWDSSIAGMVSGYYTNSIKQFVMTYGFIITDSRGVKYTFGNTDESIEFTRNGLTPFTPDKFNQNTIPSTWYLSSIQSPNGPVVRFRYKRDRFYTVATAEVKGLVITPGTFALNNQLPYTLILSATLYNPTYLDSVITPISNTKFFWSIANQQLPYSVLHPYTGDTLNSYSAYTFDPYPDVSNATGMDKRFSNKLDSFSVFTKDGVKNKSVQFTYTTDTTTRLKLLSVKIQGVSAVDGSQTYQFQYDSLALPPYRSFKTDKYGFYTGRPPGIIISSNSSYYTTFLSDTNKRKAYLLSRESDTTYTRAEVLRKITYPTGGYSYFEYENNKYGRFASNWPASVVENTSDSIGAGLRIKTITDYDFVNHVAGRKRYYYCRNYAAGGRTSSGVLNFKPVFYSEYNGPLTNPQISGFLNDPRYPGSSVAIKQFNTDPLYTPNYCKGNPISYSEVTEVNADNGYTVFKFKNYDNGYQDRPAENIYVDNPQVGRFWQEDDVNSLDMERGLILSQSKYDSSGVIKAKTVFDYNDTVTRFNNNVKVLKGIPNPAFSGNFPTLRYLAYLIYTYYPFVKKITQYEYTSATDSIVTATGYSYDSKYRSLLQQTILESDSSVRTTVNRYPPDMVAMGQTTPYQSMVALHQISPVVEKEDQVNGIKLFKQINSYAQGLSDNTSLILPSTIIAQYRSRTPEIRLRFLKYDSLGNLLSSSEPGGTKTSYILGYAKSFPVGKIVNASYDSILAALGGASVVNSFSNNPTPSATDLSTLDNNLRSSTQLTGAMISTYQYNPLIGLTKETDSRRMSNSYAYDLLGRLSTVKNTDGAVIKQYCYDYSGQPAHCFINSDVKSYQYYWSTDHTAICDIPNHMSSVALTTLYTLPHTIYDSTALLTPQFTGFFSNVPLSQRPLDGYYTYINPLGPPGIPSNFYISGGQIYYVGICSGGVPPFSLKYTDSIRKHDICDSSYPTKYVYTINNDTPALGRSLYSTFQLTTPVIDGYYLYNSKVYHSKNGLVDSALLCSVLFPPPLTMRSFTGKFSTNRTGVCTISFGVNYYFWSASSTVALGNIIYSAGFSGTYVPLAAGYVTDGTKVYTTNSSGAVTAIGTCP